MRDLVVLLVHVITITLRLVRPVIGPVCDVIKVLYADDLSTL
jgi:hypothetical protein